MGKFWEEGEGILRVSGRGGGGSRLLVGEGLEGNFGRGREILGEWREIFGVGGKFFWVLRQKILGFFL
jgi:hypothetical protein